MPTLAGIKSIIVLTGMLTLPGWATLAFADNWRRWRGLQRWAVAIGISIAFYPVFFYTIRSVIPFLTLGPYKMSALLLVLTAIVGWRLRGHWKEQFVFDRLEWAAIGIFGMTLFTRFWIIRDQAYPAWADSLHHALLTQLTAVRGQLPFDMEPYFPIPLGQYHLGSYSLSATVQWVAQVPAHTALLWTAQVLNGLCGLGVYLVLDRKAGRLGAVVGAAVVGLWSHQPAWYVNWGRFTQLFAQTIVLIAWLVTWEAIVLWKRSWQECKARILWNTVCAAVLVGAVFLLHFRVAMFFIPLLMMSVTWELGKAYKEKQITPIILGTTVIGVASLLIIAPALWQAVPIYVAAWSNDVSAATSEMSQEAMQQFYEFPWRTVPILAARLWLLILVGLGAIAGILMRNKLVIASLLWTVVLYLFGNAYLVNIPFLSLTNLGAILITLYLPVGLIIGSASEQVLTLLKAHWRTREVCTREVRTREVRTRAVQGIAVFVLITGFAASRVRITEIELFRYFVTPEDVTAMHWIDANTPPDALFAINTCFWLPGAPHGTDAGYWIPYFTGRRITAGVMLLNAGSRDYVSNIVEMSHAVEQLEVDNASLVELQELGVDYVYIGPRGDFSGLGLDVTRLAQAENLDIVYQNGGVTILQIQPPDRAD